MQILDLRGKKLSQAQLRSILPRAGSNTGSMLERVEPIVDAVKQNGARAALDFGAQFDDVTAPSMRVPQDVIAQAEHTLDPEVRSALLTAISQVRAFHSVQKPNDQVVEVIPGGKVTEHFVPIHRVGLYVPGGQAVYPSSVIMNVVPAQEAGVDSLVVASPPQKDHDGWPHPTILAACSLLDVQDVWAVGGAQAIALLAYGDQAQELEPVDLITGPGNIFVATAKHIVQQDVGIDAEAGPTEIAVLADASANPVFVAYDLISQAEHDEMAASILITDSESLAQKVGEEVDSRYKVTRNADRVAQALEGSQSGIILVDDIDAGVAVANAYAAEHLEIQTRNAEDIAGKIVNAGAIFIGDYSPVPLGDYAAGSNHVLPTSGTARYNSGLSTHAFLKSVHMISYDQNALESIGPDVITLANEELLPAHGEAIKARISPDTLSLASPKDRS